MAAPIHERQSLQLCGLHAVNALLQREYAPATASECTEIAAAQARQERELGALSWWQSSPYHSHLGLGAFGATVLVVALAARGLTVEWHDARKPLPSAPPAALLGFLVHEQPTDTLFALLTRAVGLGSGGHWFGVRAIEGWGWVNLDSALPAPSAFAGGYADVEAFLRGALARGSSVLVVSRAAGAPPV